MSPATSPLLLVLNLSSFPEKIWNHPPHTERKDRPRKEADPSGLAGGRFNKEKNVQGLSWTAIGWANLCTFPSKSQRFICEKFSHTFSPNGLGNALLSQGRILGTVASVGTVGRSTFQRGDDPLSGSCSLVKQWPHPLNSSEMFASWRWLPVIGNKGNWTHIIVSRILQARHLCVCGRIKQVIFEMGSNSRFLEKDKPTLD